MSLYDKFIDAYNVVFDSKGNLRVSGRERCIHLIEVSNEVAKVIYEPKNIPYYGNIENGFMKQTAIKKLHRELKKIESMYKALFF